ncbi:MAG: hypothetical protein GKS05_07670 [Nitrospirales bacterium]|nr:hypothetical protein [Nitrospirales bacterium]
MWQGRLIILLFAFLAILALAYSGSVTHGVLELLEDGYRDGPETSGWDRFVEAFWQDITGTPGVMVSAIKTFFAVIVAFGVAKIAPTAAGEFLLKVSGVELSGAQSAAVLWCAVFVLVKLL